MVAKAVKIAKKLEAEEHKSVEIINTRFLKPLDRNTIKESIIKTKNVITIEDGTCIGGLGSTVKELLVDNNIKDVRLKSYCYPDKFVEHGSVNQLEDRYGFNTLDIVEYIKKNFK